MKSKLEGGKLILKGKSYTSKSLHLLPDQLTGYQVSSRENDKSIGFFGELSPFSNFHEASFELDGIVFHSSEQYIQYQKARLFNDSHHQQKIIDCSSPFESKQLAREIQNFDPIEWREHAGKLCEKGITAKFQQSCCLLQLLVSTGEKTLVECAYDKLWGFGVPLRNDDCLDETLWDGDNLLGKLLMKICSVNMNITGSNIVNQVDT